MDTAQQGTLMLLYDPPLHSGGHEQRVPRKTGLKMHQNPAQCNSPVFVKKKKSPPHYICINVEYTEDPEGHIHELSPNSGSLWW